MFFLSRNVVIRTNSKVNRFAKQEACRGKQNNFSDRTYLCVHKTSIHISTEKRSSSGRCVSLGGLRGRRRERIPGNLVIETWSQFRKYT